MNVIQYLNALTVTMCCNFGKDWSTFCRETAKRSTECFMGHPVYTRYRLVDIIIIEGPTLFSQFLSKNIFVSLTFNYCPLPFMVMSLALLSLLTNKHSYIKFSLISWTRVDKPLVWCSLFNRNSTVKYVEKTV